MAARKGKGKSELPKGFAPITGGGDFWPNDNTKKGESIQGVVTGYESIPTKFDKNPEDNVIVIEQADGIEVKLWHKAMLSPLFDEDYTDVEVFIRYDGVSAKKKKGQSPATLFTIAEAE